MSVSMGVVLPQASLNVYCVAVMPFGVGRLSLLAAPPLPPWPVSHGHLKAREAQSAHLKSTKRVG
eukprot:923346-Amphidinium_carterae.1